MKTYPLRTFVRRVLMLRVLAAGVVLCVGVGAVAWYVERARMEDRILDSAHAGVHRITRTVTDRIAGGEQPLAALRQTAARVAESPVEFESGRFVAFEVYDGSGATLAEALMPGKPSREGLGAALAREVRDFPAAGEYRTRTVDAGKGWHVLVSAPVSGPKGELVGYARGVFAVSDDAATRIREAALRGALLAALVVLLVTAILYPVVLRLAVQLADYSTALLDANLESLAVLGSAIAKRDSDTDAHNYRVTLYSVRLGEAAGLEGPALRALLKGAFLHDVGKIGIPDAVLLKPGKLDDQEFAVMKGHVALGVDIVSRSTWLAESIRVVGAHHEKFKGKGYPAGTESAAIPVEARIFAIADVFDALTSERPYKQPFPFEKAMAILEEGRGVHFDPALLDLFRGLAPDLSRRYAGKGREELAGELDQVVRAWFSSGAEALRYA
jgi:HD-GYP domain-containing protein (c-di-GMP phosphodiesterase class II)